MNPTKHTKDRFRRIAFVLAIGVGVSTGSASAQTILEVGGAGVIGDETLATNTVPATGVNFTAEGGAGFVYTDLISPAVTVPTTGPVTLKFDHRYFIEAAWDGAAVFVSVNGGEATYLPGTEFTVEGYIGDTLANTPNTAWEGGEEVFYGMSPDYDLSSLIESVANLGTLNAGDTVSVVFRGGWDAAYSEPGTNWEIGSVTIEDSASTAILDVDFTADGTSGFTVESDPGLAGPWVYLKPVSTFEIDADTKTADRYAPSAAGATIDLNDAALAVNPRSATPTRSSTSPAEPPSRAPMAASPCPAAPGTWTTSRWTAPSR